MLNLDKHFVVIHWQLHSSYPSSVVFVFLLVNRHPLCVLQASELPREPLHSVPCRRRQSPDLQEPLRQLLLALLRPDRPLHNGATWNHTRPIRALQTFTRQVCLRGVLSSELWSVTPSDPDWTWAMLLITTVYCARGGLHWFRRAAGKCCIFRSAVRCVRTHCLHEDGSVVWAALPHSVEADNISSNQRNVFYTTPTLTVDFQGWLYVCVMCFWIIFCISNDISLVWMCSLTT